MPDNCLIISVTRDPLQRWMTIGETRQEAEQHYQRALAQDCYSRPIYRVVARHRPVAELGRRNAPAAAAAPGKADLIDGLIEDALSILHHDRDDDGEIAAYERRTLRKAFTARLRPVDRQAPATEPRTNPRTDAAPPNKHLYLRRFSRAE